MTSLLLLLAASPPPLPATDGRHVDPLELKGTHVLFVILAECPIARKYSSEIGRISKEFPKVPIWTVFTDPDLTVLEAKRHLRDFNLPGIGLMDTGRALTRMLRISTVPTAVVLRNGKIVYQGRIDDRFPSLGIERAPKSRDLRNALQSVQSGKVPKPAETTVVGCVLE